MRWKPFDIPAEGSNIDFTQVGWDSNKIIVLLIK